jgi:hypothetical protein
MLPFNPDFKDLLSSFGGADVRFMVVGAYALAFHGHVRATEDLDVWVECSPANAARVYSALADFGAALDAVTPQDFEDPRTEFQIGVSARRIDVVCSVTGVEFGPAWEHRETLQLDELLVPVIGLEDIIQNKRSTGRLQDAADVEALERLRQYP